MVNQAAETLLDRMHQLWGFDIDFFHFEDNTPNLGRLSSFAPVPEISEHTYYLANGKWYFTELMRGNA